MIERPGVWSVGVKHGEPCAGLCCSPLPARLSPASFDVSFFISSLNLNAARCCCVFRTRRYVAIDVIKALVVAALTHNARAAASVFSAGLSHQLRDATRRGLWLYPPRGPTTPPLGYPVYLVAQALLPLLVVLCLRAGFVSRCRKRCVRGELHAAPAPSESFLRSFLW